LEETALLQTRIVRLFILKDPTEVFKIPPWQIINKLAQTYNPEFTLFAHVEFETTITK